MSKYDYKTSLYCPHGTFPTSCGQCTGNFINELEAELTALREAAQALLTDIDTLRPEFRPESTRGTEDALAALLRPIVYPDEIPVDRAGRPMYNKYGDKLDIEDRE